MDKVSLGSGSIGEQPIYLFFIFYFRDLLHVLL